MNAPTSSTREDLAEGLRRGVLLGVALAALVIPPSRPVSWHAAPGNAVGSLPPASVPPTARALRLAEFNGEPASGDARFVANWVADSGDNGGRHFVIVDKKHTKVFVFDGQARLLGATPVLLGAQPGDDTVPGIGSRPIADVRPEERTTPAGRFMGERGRNATGEDVVWVDYDAAVSMHRVRLTNPQERRAERLASATTDDNRISYGCINVPVPFYEAFLRPTFAQQKAPVYVLPEIKPVAQVFGAYQVAATEGNPPSP
jgi:hypothetical protein